MSPVELPSDGRVAIDSLTDEFTNRPTEFTNEWIANGNELPDGLDPDAHAVDPFTAEPLGADDRIDLGDRTLEVTSLPGHSPGHLGVLDPEAGVLYGGDVIHFDRNLYVMFEDSDLDDYIGSLVRVRELRDDDAFSVLATSHNEPMSGADLSLVDDLVKGLREIADGERDYEVVETDWGEARWYEIGPSEVLTKTTI